MIKIATLVLTMALLLGSAEAKGKKKRHPRCQPVLITDCLNRKQLERLRDEGFVGFPQQQSLPFCKDKDLCDGYQRLPANSCRCPRN